MLRQRLAGFREREWITPRNRKKLQRIWANTDKRGLTVIVSLLIFVLISWFVMWRGFRKAAAPVALDEVQITKGYRDSELPPPPLHNQPLVTLTTDTRLPCLRIHPDDARDSARFKAMRTAMLGHLGAPPSGIVPKMYGGRECAVLLNFQGTVQSSSGIAWSPPLLLANPVTALDDNSGKWRSQDTTEMIEPPIALLPDDPAKKRERPLWVRVDAIPIVEDSRMAEQHFNFTDVRMAGLVHRLLALNQGRIE